HTTYWIEAQAVRSAIGGLDPMVFHITNIILHAAGAILLWFILRELGLSGAWIAALIWAIHPMQTESAAWISERKNVLCVALFMGSLLAYLRAWRIGRADCDEDDTSQPFPWNLYATSLMLFLGALLSKPLAC